MKVKWTEQMSASRAMMLYDMYPDANACDFDKDYEGEVIGTVKSFFGITYLVVACTDNKIREVDKDNAIIIP
jgi:hypothetical protein